MDRDDCLFSSGSGKSTFADCLAEYNSTFVRISQDRLGSRPACESLAKSKLEEGFSVIIDRQNFDIQQRARWIQLGKQMPNVRIDVIEFDTPVEECVTRLQKRTDHETLKNFAEAKGILNLGIKNWVPPHPSEGYERHLQLYPVPLGATHESNASSTRPGRSSVVRHPISYPNSPTLIGSIMSLLESTPAVELSDIPPQQQNRRSHPSRGSKRGGQKSHGSASESSRKQSSRS